MACAPVEGVCIGRKSTKQESFTGGEDQQNCKMVDHVLPGHQMWASALPALVGHNSLLWQNQCLTFGELPEGRPAGGKGDPTDHEDQHCNWKEIKPPTTLPSFLITLLDMKNNLKFKKSTYTWPLCSANYCWKWNLEPWCMSIDFIFFPMPLNLYHMWGSHPGQYFTTQMREK